MPDFSPVVNAPLICTNAGFDALEAEWGALAQNCPTAAPFQLWGWNRAWWRHFGAGRRLRIVCLRDADGLLVAVLPLYEAFWYGSPVRVLRLLGTGQSDYGDALCLPGREQDAARCFWQALQNLSGWAILDFQPLKEGGFLRTRMANAPLPLRTWEQVGEVCPYLPMPPAWDALRAQWGRKTRANVGYYDRAWQKQGTLDISFCADPALLDGQMAHLFRLHGLRWRGRGLPGVFAGARVRRFHRQAARALLEAGSLRLWSLTVNGGDPLAMLYCFAWGQSVCYYQGGWEPEWARLSPGTVLTAHALRSALAEGRAEFDFLRGDEAYKSKWTGAKRAVLRRIISRSDRMLVLARRVAQAEQGMENRVKQWAAKRA